MSNGNSHLPNNGLATEQSPLSSPMATGTPPSSDYQSASSKSPSFVDEVDESYIPIDEDSLFIPSTATLNPATRLSLFEIVAVLSTAFSYGCIMTTLFLITLPLECQRIHQTTHPNFPKSVALGIFVAMAGVTQLISPLVGHLSDLYQPPEALAPNPTGLKDSPGPRRYHALGQRLPYMMFGSTCTVIGLLGQMMASYAALWIRYGLAFSGTMIGLNIMYAMMMALIPDQVPRSQTGVANGSLALLLVTGSLFGFGLFHSFLSQDLQSMYGLYTCIVIVSSILTGTHAHDRDAALTAARIARRSGSLTRPPVDQKKGLAGNGHPANLAGTESPDGKWHRRAKKVARKVAHKAKIVVLTPGRVLKSMTDPLQTMDYAAWIASYTIDRHRYHDFFVVTISRLFYYCGMSVQTFFLYYVQDVIHVRDDPQAAVASLAILGQCFGALTCFPVGVISDQGLGGRRKPFVYFSCAILSTCVLLIISATTLRDMAILSSILGAANGIYLTMDTSLAVDTLPHGQEGTLDLESVEGSSSCSAQLLGVWGVAAFLGSALGPMVGGPLLYYFGRQSETAAHEMPSSEEYTLTGYAVVLSLSAFYFMCSAVTLRFVKDAR